MNAAQRCGTCIPVHTLHTHTFASAALGSREQCQDIPFENALDFLGQVAQVKHHPDFLDAPKNEKCPSFAFPTHDCDIFFHLLQLGLMVQVAMILCFDGSAATNVVVALVSRPRAPGQMHRLLGFSVTGIVCHGLSYGFW